MKASSTAGSGTADYGLFFLRIFLGLNLFFHHGLEKVEHFSQMSRHFPDPIHIGSHASLVFALISDAICAWLVVLGFGTRIAALICAVNIGAAFVLVHHHPFSSGHGELMLLYIGGFLALIFTGGGRFSLNRF